MPLTSLLELLLLAAIWGASFIFMRIAAPELGAPVLIIARVFLAGLMFVPVLAKPKYRQELKENLRYLGLFGVINSALPFTLLAYASIYLQAGFTSILNATVPFFGILISYFVLREKVTRAQFLGLVLGFAGVFVLIGFKGSGWSSDEIIATIAGFVAALMYAIAAPMAKKNLSHVSSSTFVLGSQLGATLFLLPLIPFTYKEAELTLPVIASVLCIGFLCTGVAYVLYFRLLHSIGTAKVLTVTYLMPIAAMFWGAVVLSEAITTNMVIGCAMILIGTAVANEIIGGKAPQPGS